MQALADEASGPRGMLLPTPVDGADPTITALKADLKEPSRQGRAWWSPQVSRMGRRRIAVTGLKATGKARRLGAAPGASLIEQASLASKRSLCRLRYPVIACGQDPREPDKEKVIAD